MFSFSQYIRIFGKMDILSKYCNIYKTRKGPNFTYYTHL